MVYNKLSTGPSLQQYTNFVLFLICNGTKGEARHASCPFTQASNVKPIRAVASWCQQETEILRNPRGRF
jgi:hypothetical protein